MKLDEIRKHYPMYDDIPDDQFVKAFHSKHYSDLPFKDFSKKIGYLKGAQPEEYDPESPEFKEKWSPTRGMSGFEKFRAGWGKSAVDIARGAGQMVGAVSRDDIKESRANDSALMATGAGKAGNIVGSIANLAPAAFIPGANTLAGSAAVGAGLGLLQPSTSTKETLTNTALGGVLSPATILGARAVTGAAKGAKAALWDPFTDAGQNRIASRTLEGFAGGADEAAKAAQNIRGGMNDVLPGVQPTTAELAGNAGLAQLERTLKNNPEYMTQFADRAASNKNAMLGALDNIAGDDATRTAAEAARKGAAAPLYQQADNVAVTADDALTGLLSRPSMQKAIARAEALAAEKGETFSIDQLTGKSLHTLKMAMDDLLDNSAVSGIGKNEAGSIKGTRDALVSWIDNAIPSYKGAREAFAAGSKPINQMDVGSALRDKLVPALGDMGANTRLRPESFAQAVRNGEATAANATGMGNASLESVLTPEQMQTVLGIGKQLGRRVNADELGRAVGSNTSQNIVGQNVTRQFLGPLGLPESAVSRAAGSTIMQSLTRPLQFVGKFGEQRAFQKLVDAGLDPQLAIKILEAAAKNAPKKLKYQTVGGYQSALIPAASGSYAAAQ